VPASTLAAGATVMDPDARVTAMLGAASDLVRSNPPAHCQHDAVDSLP
jgi:hypothetical protein